MPGLEAINATGSWKVAIIAPTIVFISLSLLAVLVSAMERVLRLLDASKETLANFFKRQGEDLSPQDLPAVLSGKAGVIPLNDEEREAAVYLAMIVQRMGEPFDLNRLMELAEQLGVPHYGEHIHRLLESGCIQESEAPQERGLYYWKGVGDEGACVLGFQQPQGG